MSLREFMKTHGVTHVDLLIHSLFFIGSWIVGFGIILIILCRSP